MAEKAGPPMRILYFVHAFPPEMIAGAERATFSLAKHLSARQEVAVAYVSNKARQYPHLSQGNYQGIEVFRLHAPPPETPEGKLGLAYPAMEELFLQALEKFRPDLVHVQHTIRASINILRLLKAKGLPVIYTAHDFWLLCPRINLFRPDGARCAGPEEGRACLAAGCYPEARQYNPFGDSSAQSSASAREQKILRRLKASAPGLFKRLLPESLKYRIIRRVGPLSPPTPDEGETALPADAQAAAMMAERAKLFRQSISLPDYIITPSRHLRKKLIEYGADENRVVMIPNVLELPYGEARAPSSPPVFGYLGTLFAHKGAHVLLQAAADLSPRQARFLIAGKGDPVYEKGLRDWAKRRPNIKFLGEIRISKVPDFFRSIDALVIPSVCVENAPITLQEALAAKRPVIGSDIGGIAEIIDSGKNGLLFPPGDAAALRQLLAQISAAPNRLVEFAKALPAPYDPKAAALAHEALYQKLAQPPG